MIRRSMAPALPYREFYYPLNVFMHILTHEEGGVDSLHYGLFAAAGEPIGAAQERSTELLLSRLPPPPARILEVGIGLGTTLDRLTRLGYEAEGITPDEQQIAMAKARHGEALPVRGVGFEALTAPQGYDLLVFQESAQYIDAPVLFARARELAPRLLVLDEFALQPLEAPGALHSRERFLAAAGQAGFALTEELDLSAQAAPTVDYFLARLPRYREPLKQDLALTDPQVDELIASGERYRELYRTGVYGYRLLQLARAGNQTAAAP